MTCANNTPDWSRPDLYTSNKGTNSIAGVNSVGESNRSGICLSGLHNHCLDAIQIPEMLAASLRLGLLQECQVKYNPHFPPFFVAGTPTSSQVDSEFFQHLDHKGCLLSDCNVGFV